jgi:uncharacterized protein YdiU (UPF0061 family)
VPEIDFDNTYARLPDGFFARVAPASVPSPSLVKVNGPLATELGLNEAWLKTPAGIAMLSGNALPAGAEPIAMAYAGHQFGGFSPQLGDGRAILLGELVGPDGVRRDVQLKGAGQTPFSRNGDGKSPLGPVIREYLVSEAMAALGIPTTRALAAVATGELVQREESQPGGVLTRVAQSHIRVGTFQFFAARGETESLRKLADYVIARHYPDARQSGNPARALLDGIIERQASLIAKWMQIGFVHGVMNTDNTQIVGETIDFGPCAFMEPFDARTVFSSIDHRGRYAWGKQPSIAHWNLVRLAEALLPLLADDEDSAVKQAGAALEGFSGIFNGQFLDGFRRKLGLAPSFATDPEGTEAFVNLCFDVMAQQKVDFTLFFRHLTLVAGGASPEQLLALFNDPSAGQQWLEGWHAAGPKDVEAMRTVNPIFIPRNHRVEEAIQGALRGDYAPFERLNAVLARPFEEQPEHAEFENPPKAGEVVEHTFCGT